MVVMLASVAMSPVAQASTIYKCGTTYSQFPCPAGEVIKADDLRSAAQKKQSDRATSRDIKLADNIEKGRLKQERLDIAANAPPSTAKAGAVAPKENSRKASESKARKPAWFVARVPGEQRKERK